MSTPQPILTIIPGGRTVLVSLRAADGTQALPREIAVDLDWRLAAFVAAVQAIAGQQLARIKASAIGRPGLAWPIAVSWWP